MKGTHKFEATKELITDIRLSAVANENFVDCVPISEIVRCSQKERRFAESVGLLDEWLDAFWHNFALTVAHENRRTL